MPQKSHRKIRFAGTHRLLGCALLVLMAALYGCSTGTTRKNALIKSSKKVESSAAEISARNQSLLARYSAEIEDAADKVIFQSSSPDTRRQALEWKAEGIPVLQATLLKTDPLAAALDTWAFILQMEAYMQQPAVKQGWGAFYPTVAETLDTMDMEMQQLLQTAAPSANIAAARQKVDAWAKAHPIEAGLPGRKSADADLISRTEQSDLGTRGTIKALGESLGDLTARLDAYNAYLPKQGRWQAELLLMDMARDPRVRATTANMATLSNALAKTSGSVERMPESIEQMRKAALADFEGQRLGLQAFLREERMQVMNAVDQERIATVKDFHDERLAATADLRGERQIVLDALHNEQAATVSAINAASEKALADFDTRARGLIDHFFVRALELVLLIAVLCCLAAWFLLRRFNAARRNRGPAVYDRAA